ncbi:hypothetical protein Dsin_024475 [Dipteronia sinensis]|uniref:RNase H type-1 domain-containing protein n=1 Tax=Dipteronia sinensis TaxID=43782 RepID=A0AAD9ZU29_9ROSI|nr:hypothetical protein Dsin_024475 [Dipteronia sinensis]
MWGRSFLLKDLRWKMGNGSSIEIFKDQWLPRPSTFKPVTPDPRSDMRVAALIDHDFLGWNLELLDQTLLPVDREVILSIPISLSGGPDSLSWHYKNSGAYYVKSGYRVALSETLRASVSNSSPVHNYLQKLPVAEVLSTLLSQVSKDDMASICIITWEIWENRNTTFHGQLKLNSTVVVYGKMGSAGVGVANRDVKGKVIVALSKHLLGNYNPVTSDLLALREGLLLAKDYNFSVQNVEVSSSLVASFLNSPESWCR